MNLSTSSQQGAAAPDFSAYQKFAATSYDKEKIVVGVNGHKIQIATKGPHALKHSSFLAKDGLEYELLQEEKGRIVDHFKKALELKYGEVAKNLFLLKEESEALEHGLSHRIVKEVTERAQLPSLLLRKAQSLTTSIQKLKKDNPLFEKSALIEEAKSLIETADPILSSLGHDSAHVQNGSEEMTIPLTQLDEEIQKLKTAIAAAEARVFSSISPTSSGFSSMSSNKPALDFGEAFTKAHAERFEKLDALKAAQGTQSNPRQQTRGGQKKIRSGF